MKILHVEAGRNLYGGALQVLYLLRGLQEKQCHNILVCPHDSAIAKSARDVTTSLYTLPMRGDLDIPFIWRLKRIIEREQPDIVHLHSRRGADVLGGIAARLAKVPVILSRRVDNPEPRSWAKYKYRLFDRVITISEYIKHVLVSEGVPQDKIQCIPSTVDTEQYMPHCDSSWFEVEFGTRSSHVIGVVAQLIERKGHCHLLDAIPKVLEEYPDTQFIFFGKGPLETALKNQIKKMQLQQCVHLVGFRNDIERVLPCFYLLAHPAEMEGLGIAMLQASACGVPVVASAVGGIPEIVRHGENGLLVPSANPQALADALLVLLRDPEKRRRMADAGRRIVEEDFSIDAMVQGNLDVYHKLLAQIAG